MKTEEALAELRRIISGIGPMVVGSSAGADSTLLLKVAHDVLGEGVVGITTVSPTRPETEREEAARLAREIGARQRFVPSGEMGDPRFLANSSLRCYFCRSDLFRILREEARALGFGAIAYGAQRDDLGEFRPGMDAARECGARAPLLEAGLGKAEIRDVSRLLGLPTWNKPAMACLSSRIPHGTPISAMDLFTYTLATPVAWIEFAAYSLASSEGIMIIVSLFFRRLRREAKPLLLALVVSISLLVLGGFVEVFLIEAMQSQGLQMVT